MQSVILSSPRRTAQGSVSFRKRKKTTFGTGESIRVVKHRKLVVLSFNGASVGRRREFKNIIKRLFGGRERGREEGETGKEVMVL